MPKIAVVTPDKAGAAPMPEGFGGPHEAFSYLEADRFPLQLHLHELAPGQTLALASRPADCALYVWSGAAECGAQPLPAGSSVLVERGAESEITGAGQGAKVLAFTSTGPDAAATGEAKVHLLPVDRVPRSDDLGTGSGVGGAMHADSACPTCAIWLHENWFPGAGEPDEEAVKRGIHSHSEDEIIFVIDGSMRLGNRLVGPGTALAISADTLYGFTPGPDGLHFINFRAAMPGDIRFASGPSISETEYWRGKLPRPDYLEPA